MTNRATDSNRIRFLRLQAKLTQGELAANIGVATNTLCQYELGSRQVPDSVKHKLADYFGVTVDYLLCREYSPDEPAMRPVRYVPILGVIRAGAPILAEENILGYAPCPMGANDSEGFWLKVEGDSMEPLVHSGALAWIKQQDFAQPGDVVAVVVDNNCATLKRYKPLNNQVVLFQAENPNAESYTVSAVDFVSGSVRILGVCETVSYSLKQS